MGSAKAIKEKNIRGLGEGSIFEVQENAVLYCGSFNISGEGTFKLSDNASIFIGSPDGINSNKLKGNILTGNRIYSSSANYIYYQGSPAQQTGVFNTTPDERTVNNLIIQKDDARQSVILNSDLTVRGEFREVMGKLDRNAKTLTLIHMSGSSKEERGSNYTEIPKEKKIRKYKN